MTYPGLGPAGCRAESGGICSGPVERAEYPFYFYPYPYQPSTCRDGAPIRRRPMPNTLSLDGSWSGSHGPRTGHPQEKSDALAVIAGRARLIAQNPSPNAVDPSSCAARTRPPVTGPEANAGAVS